MKKTIRWGILGCGDIARKFAASAERVAGTDITAAASRTPGKAASFAAEFGIPRHYDNYNQLLEDDEVDAVYVATTHNFHYDNVREVLEAGKHVLCEKPMTVNGREMKILSELAADKKLFMMEAMWTRFLPCMVYVRRLLKEGLLGEIRQVRATFGFQFPFNPDHRLYNLSLAGGALLDAGIYPLSFAHMVMKEKPAEIRSLAQIGTTGVDEQSMYLFKYKSGALAVLSSCVNAPVVSRAEIIGTKGRIIIPDKFLAGVDVFLELKGEDRVVSSFDFDDKTGFSYEIEAASESIRKGEVENKIMPVSDSLALMETIDVIKDQLGLVYENDNRV